MRSVTADVTTIIMTMTVRVVTITVRITNALADIAMMKIMNAVAVTTMIAPADIITNKKRVAEGILLLQPIFKGELYDRNYRYRI